MTCDKRYVFSAPSSVFHFPPAGRPRLFSAPEKQDLETIYEVKPARARLAARTRIDYHSDNLADSRA
jgi:hypothetical protein